MAKITTRLMTALCYCFFIMFFFDFTHAIHYTIERHPTFEHPFLSMQN